MITAYLIAYALSVVLFCGIFTSLMHDSLSWWQIALLAMIWPLVLLFGIGACLGGIA
jgi:hypothetical protein